MAALTGYDTTKSFTLTFGSTTTLPITGTTNVAGVSYAYTAAGIKAAIEAVTGGTVTVAGFYGPAPSMHHRLHGSPTAARLPAERRQRGAQRRRRLHRLHQRHRQGRWRRPPTVAPSTTTSNHNPDRHRPDRQDDPAAHAVHPDRVGHRLRRRHAGLPLGAERPRRDRRHRRHQPDQQHQDQRPAVPGVRHVRQRVGADTLLYSSPGENIADGNPSRTFPDMAQILAGHDQRRHGRVPAPVATDSRTTQAPPGPCWTASRSTCRPRPTSAAPRPSTPSRRSTSA